MITLGIETSCDETAVAVLKDKKILSNVVASSMHLHKRYGGVVPEIATRYHVEVINHCLNEALKEAGIGFKKIDLISVTQGPGLIGALLIGISFAKALSFSLGVPLVGTNHVIAHLWANFLEGRKLDFPFIGLAVSGGHTSIILVKGVNDYSVLGQTQDDAVGEAFDKVAKILNLGYPGGPAIEKCAKETPLSERVRFQAPSAPDGLYDFSFSGIKTAVLYYVKDRGGVEHLSKKEVSKIASGFQEAACNAVEDNAIRACMSKGIKVMAVGGGVSANSRLREKLYTAARSNGIKVFIPQLKLCLDNAAMTAVLGAALFKKGVKADEYISGFANFNA